MPDARPLQSFLTLFVQEIEKELMQESSTDRGEVRAQILECLEFKRVVGVHHFSGSWLGLDGTKSGWLKDEVSKRGILEHAIFV